MKKIDRETPKDKVVDLICDNYATQKHPILKLIPRTEYTEISHQRKYLDLAGYTAITRGYSNP